MVIWPMPWRSRLLQHQLQPPTGTDRAPPAEALADFLNSEIDALFLGNLLATKDLGSAGAARLLGSLD